MIKQIKYSASGKDEEKEMTEKFLEELSKSFENENNEDLVNLSLEQINRDKLEILKEIIESNSELDILNEKLRDYRYISDIKDLKFGSYIRSINLTKYDDIKLNRGGVIVDMSVSKTGINILCMNSRRMKYTLKFEQNLVFQRLNDQETLILTVMDLLKES